MWKFSSTSSLHPCVRHDRSLPHQLPLPPAQVNMVLLLQPLAHLFLIELILLVLFHLALVILRCVLAVVSWPGSIRALGGRLPSSESSSSFASRRRISGKAPSALMYPSSHLVLLLLHLRSIVGLGRQRETASGDPVQSRATEIRREATDREKKKQTNPQANPNL